MMREEHGEYLYTLQEGIRDTEYIKGHVTDDEAMAILKREDCAVIDKSVTIRQRYARWGFPEEMFASEGYDRMLNLYDEPARGRFKITEVRQVD